MKEIFKKKLFTKHILVHDCEKRRESDKTAFSVMVALGQLFDIRVHGDIQLLDESMLRMAEECIGRYVPPSFYGGFPESVRSLTKEQLLYDQLMHYVQTYGLGDFSEPGHSRLETVEQVLEFNEHTEVKDFTVLSETDADGMMTEILKNLLESSRPLSLPDEELVIEGLAAYGDSILPVRIPCKHTAVVLLYKTRQMEFVKHIMLSDVIKLLEYIQYTQYGSEKLNKLNLRNKDRKFLTKVLDVMFTMDRTDIKTCLEKKKTWCGLLHHLHYKPKTPAASRFVGMVRGCKGGTVYSDVEFLMKSSRVEAAQMLVTYKGTGALIRNLDYILSRCETQGEVKGVLSCLK